LLNQIESISKSILSIIEFSFLRNKKDQLFPEKFSFEKGRIWEIYRIIKITLIIKVYRNNKENYFLTENLPLFP